MGKYKPIILLGAGIIVALVTSFLTYDWLNKKAEAKIATPQKTLEIAVASVDLPWGRVITNDMFEYKHYLQNSLPEGHFTKESSLEGRVVITPVKVNEPIFESSLAPTSIKTGGVAAVIGSSKRAMAVKVDKVIGVSGFIYPGNRVDVLVTLRRDGKDHPFTKTVLENVLVLAVGTKIETEGKGQKPSPVDVITLEVDPNDAEKLAHAATEGKIQLSMRNFMDTDDVLTKGSTRNTLLTSYSSRTPKQTVQRKNVKESYSVEVIRGSDISKVKVSGRYE